MAREQDQRPLRPISSLLSGPQGLGGIIDRARELSRLDAKVKSVLPPSIAAHCAVANVRDATLVLTTTAGVFTARLRLMSPQIIAAMGEIGIEVTQVKFRVGYVPPPPPPPREPMPMSETARRHLLDAAQKVDDPELRAMIESLATSQDKPPPAK